MLIKIINSVNKFMSIPMTPFTISSYIFVDALTLCIFMLVSIISLSVARFAYQFMNGDKLYGTFFLRLFALVGSVVVLVAADHILIFLFSLAVSHGILVKLMIHKSSWKAAKFSGMMALKNFIWSFISLSISFSLLYQLTGETSIHRIASHSPNHPLYDLALILLIISAMAQSAIWPFHRWLLSSLNSPTPVSALMHAGLINGGGILLIRFSPLLLQSPYLLQGIFVVGMFTAILGTLWKLIQPDVKKMLSCSTMGQMGFMFVQCGLGLFQAALIHIFCHGLFKAYLFLTSSNSAQEKRFDHGYPPKLSYWGSALICSVIATFCFLKTSHIALFTGDTHQFFILMTLITSTQLALSLLHPHPLKKFPMALIITSLAAGLYGASMHTIETFFVSLDLMTPQPLTIWHGFGMVALLMTWMSHLILPIGRKNIEDGEVLLNLYVKALNGSQPHPSTVTAHRNQYQYR